MPRRALAALLLGLLPCLVMGCFNPFQPRIASNRGISDPPPNADSPRNVLRRFEWCWEHRAIAEYRELFTKDFRFVFATADSSGNAYLDHGWTREDELASAQNLFLGGNTNQPAATQIILDFDANLIALPDSRPGKIDPWHKEIFTRVDLTINTDELQTRSIGSARFFVVRGDSAQIPEELGLSADQNRWYIERYEEENSTSGLANRARPARAPDARGGLETPLRAQIPPGPWYVSWGFVKSIYRR